MSFRKNFARDVVEVCTATGCLIKQHPNAQQLVEYQHAPINLFQTPYPFHIYKQVHLNQEPIGRLVSDLTANPDKISSILSGFLKYDSFLANLVQVSQEYNKYAQSEDPEQRKLIQTMQMCILRSDFMIDTPSNEPKLVEYNTIAASLGVLTEQVIKVQRYIKQKYSDKVEFNYQQLDDAQGLSQEDKDMLHFGNNCMNDFSDKLISYFDVVISQYKKSVESKFGANQSTDPWVLFVVGDDERNMNDQKIMEYQLQVQYGIKSMRLTFEDLIEEIDFNKTTHILKVRGHEIGFVYYRSGYQVEQFPTKAHWDARTTLELSQAIKCPSIDYHLLTFKKFQQSFCSKQVIEDILGPDKKDILPRLDNVFRGMWSLEDYEHDENVQKTVQTVIDDPREFVVKPQKEGGGNNYFDKEAADLLKKFVKLIKEGDPEAESLKQFMIMERINPPMIKSWFLKEGKVLEIDSLSEFGLFSFLLMDTENKRQNKDILIRNENFGSLMRTKGSHSNEGGVNSGHSVIDHPILYIAQENKVSEDIKPNVASLAE